MARKNASNQYCNFDSPLPRMFTSSLYLAALVTSFFATTSTRVLGRKWSMFGGSVTFLIGAASNVLMLILGCVLLDIGVGFANQLTMAIAILLFQQFTGMNVIMFYAPVLFKTLGFTGGASLIFAVITGVVNVFATFISIFTVDKLGRHKLFLEGGTQMLACYSLL